MPILAGIINELGPYSVVGRRRQLGGSPEKTDGGFGRINELSNHWDEVSQPV